MDYAEKIVLAAAYLIVAPALLLVVLNVLLKLRFDFWLVLFAIIASLAVAAAYLKLKGGASRGQGRSARHW